MSLESRDLDDLVILGRGAPDVMRDGRITICVAGWSPKIGLVRIYPTKLTSPLRQWNVVSVPVERNPTDNRAESWKITGSLSDWDRLDDRIQVQGELTRDERIALIPKLATRCVTQLNESHTSLGVVRPREIRGYLSDRADVDHTLQRTLLGGLLPKTKINYPMQPRLSYRCGGCQTEGGHDQQIIEIGCYEWFRKNPGNEAQVFDNLRIGDPDFEKYLLVGNQVNHRTSYLVIGVIRWKRSLKGHVESSQFPTRAA